MRIIAARGAQRSRLDRRRFVQGIAGGALLLGTRGLLGRTAATMLVRLINGEALEMTRVVLPTEFIERQSCRPLSL